MNQANSGNPFRRANRLAGSPDRVVKAIVVEEASLVRRVIEESESEICNRCLDPRRAIAGIVVFRASSLDMIMRLGGNDWVLCATCLNSLKEYGCPDVSHDGNHD
jgi:hypothetical protein